MVLIMESRDLRPIFDEIRGLLSCRDLELTVMVVYDRETDSWEALDDNSDVGRYCVKALKKL